MHWMIEPFRRYADFSGRSRRVEFWSFILFQWLVYIGLGLVFVLGVGGVAALGEGNIGDAQAAGLGVGVLLLLAFAALFWLGTLIPNLAVAARRMQDIDQPGIIGILLVIGGMLFTLPYLVMAVFGFMDGTRGDNRFGPDPKHERQVGAIFD